MKAFPPVAAGLPYKGALTERLGTIGLLGALGLCLTLACNVSMNMNGSFRDYQLDYHTPVDNALQARLESIDAGLRGKLGMQPHQAALGLLDLNTRRLAMIDPDREEYGASVPKIGILLAYFQLHRGVSTNLTPAVRHDLGLIIKVSDNAMAARFSRELGIRQIQAVLNSYGLYDPHRGGGLWVGKHYGQDTERYGDPVADHSHAATVRQVLRYFLMLEQGKFVSQPASATMRKIFASPEIPHTQNKFVKGLAGRPVEIIRKSGSWEDWLHDAAVVTGGGRHYILVALTKHPKGDEYLAELASAVDDLMR